MYSKDARKQPANRPASAVCPENAAGSAATHQFASTTVSDFSKESASANITVTARNTEISFEKYTWERE